MKNVLIITLVAVGLVAVVLGFPKARTYLAVGRTGLAEAIEKSLGQFTVKRYEANEGIEKLQQGIRDLQKGMIECQVQSEQLASKVQTLQEKKQRSESSLGKLRDLISLNEPAILAGKEYSVVQLQALADEVIRTHGSVTMQISGIEKAGQLLVNNAQTLDDRIKQGQSRIVVMQSQLDQIDAKILALQTISQAAKTVGDDSRTLAENFQSVQDQLNDLYAQVEIGLRTEEQQWSDSALTDETTVDKILAETQTLDSTLARIDTILAQ